MTVTIYDMDSSYEAVLRSKSNVLIHADGQYAPCQGCFGCWTRHPAECFMKDKLQRVCRVVGQADTLILVSENCYGSYSPHIKTVLDRSIGLSTPFSVRRGKQMHHTLRYGKHGLLRVFVYGDMSDQEKETFLLLAERNAINYGYEKSEVIFLKDLSELEGYL